MKTKNGKNSEKYHYVVGRTIGFGNFFHNKNLMR